MPCMCMCVEGTPVFLSAPGKQLRFIVECYSSQPSLFLLCSVLCSFYVLCSVPEQSEPASAFPFSLAAGNRTCE